MNPALKLYADLVDEAIVRWLKWCDEQQDDDTEEEGPIGGALSIPGALELADGLRGRLRRLKRDELLDLAAVGLAVGIYDGEVDRDLRKVARGEDYSRFPAPPPGSCCAPPEPDQTTSAEEELDLAVIAVEESIDEEVTREGVHT